MNMDDLRVRGLLEEIAADPAPPSVVDVDRAIFDGRRGIHRRRFTAVGAGVLTVVALAGVAAVVNSRPTGEGQNQVTAGATASVQPPPPGMPARAPVKFDPELLYAEFGWLPFEMTHTSIDTQRGGFFLEASTSEGTKAPRRIGLTIGARGGNPPAGDRLVGAEAIADPVNGRPAQWRNGLLLQADAILAWEYAPDSWAAVSVSGMGAGVDPRQVARRVAAAIRYEVNTRIALPLRAEKLPTGYAIGAIQLSRSVLTGSYWVASIQYGPARKLDGSPLIIKATLAESDPPPQANTTVDGHQARIIDERNLQVFNVQGIDLDLEAWDRGIEGVPDGLKGVFRGLKLYPDPAQWR